jgi:mono/diheme cytochrome c family protein
MSIQPPSDPRLDQAASSDDSLLSAHESLLGRQPDERASYRLTPIMLLFGFSGLILFAGTYLNRYAGHYDPAIYNENAVPGGPEAAPVAVDMVALGKKQFNAVCITCHQSTGLGQAGIYPPLAGSEWVNGPEDRIIRIVLDGLKGTVHVAGHEYGAAAMPVFGQVAGSGYNWSDEKIAAVLTYIRQEWGNKAPPVTVESVTKVHQATGDHKEWAEAELAEIK